MIPDPSELDVVEKNLLILEDCFLGHRTKWKHTMQGVDIIIVIPFTNDCTKALNQRLS